MPNYILIDPTNQTVQNYNAEDWMDAIHAAGLDVNALDHGNIGRGTHGSINIWVYEFGLISPQTDKYFAIEKQLFNGPAVMYFADLRGETIDVPLSMAEHLKSNHLRWFSGTSEVEDAIGAGRVTRPASSINGQIVWEWNKGKTN